MEFLLVLSLLLIWKDSGQIARTPLLNSHTYIVIMSYTTSFLFKCSYVSMEKYMGILHESDSHMKVIKTQKKAIQKYATARIIRFCGSRHRGRMKYNK